MLRSVKTHGQRLLFSYVMGWGASATAIALKKIASSKFHLALIGLKGTIQDNDLSEPTGSPYERIQRYSSHHLINAYRHDGQ